MHWSHNSPSATDPTFRIIRSLRLNVCMWTVDRIRRSIAYTTTRRLRHHAQHRLSASLHINAHWRHDRVLSPDAWKRTFTCKAGRREACIAGMQSMQVCSAAGVAFVTDHSSECVWTIAFERNDLWARYLALWFNITLSRSSSMAKDIGQSPRSHNDKSSAMDTVDWLKS